MSLLVLGLALFLGVHSLRIFAEGTRTALVGRLGANGFKVLYSVLSIVGFVLIVKGYAAARLDPVPLWAPMFWARHLASLLTLVALILLVAAYVPRNGIKARLHHPMVLGVKTWALAHLLANHTLADVLLFGGFLAWAALSYRAARARDRAAGTAYAQGTLAGTLAAVVLGAGAWAFFAFYAHVNWFGVAPIARAA